jgi:pyrimidine operon attenuation protein/uracil phosphoribosyltransferase
MDNSAKKIHNIINNITKNYPSGDIFFTKLDGEIKNPKNLNLTTELFTRIKNEFGDNFNIVVSGGYGRFVMNLIEKGVLDIKGTILQLSGGITSHKTDMDKIKKESDPKIIWKNNSIKNKEFIFIDDSYYSGTTEVTIKEFLENFNSTITKTFVLYDGNDKRSPNRESLYRYYDWNVGTNRSFNELNNELSNYNNILSNNQIKEITNKIKSNQIKSIIQLRKEINSMLITSNKPGIDIYSRIREEKNIKLIYNNMLKYSEFINEKVMYNLLLESQVKFSNKFIDVLKNIDTPVSNAILKLHNKDLDITQNYIDIDLSNSNMITFTQDSKAKQIEEETKNHYKIDNKSKHLKVSDFNTEKGEKENTELFRSLGLDIKDFSKENRGNVGDIIKVINSVESPLNKKTYHFYELLNNPEIKSVIGDDGVSPKSYDKVWSTSRNPYRIGRWTNSILNLAGESFSNSDIEKFVNDYKSNISILNDAFSKFDVVDKYDIHYWYHKRNYESESGTLGSSCMAGVPEKVLQLYIQNPNVCRLVILYSDNGSIKDGKYKSNKIIGRALLWELSDGRTFMDRIYTIKDSDVNLFKKYAEHNGWWCKKEQNTSSKFSMSKGDININSGTLKVLLDDPYFDYYPYLDTLSYINYEKKYLTNDDELDHDDCLDSTYDRDEDEDEDEEWG